MPRSRLNQRPFPAESKGPLGTHPELGAPSVQYSR
jgi:hypothetical protein